MATASAFNPLFFESPVVKITLAEDHDSQVAAKFQPNMEQSDSNRTTQNSIFYIHKELLTSVSPELRKHIDNDMKEGLRGEITLAEVERQTMQYFLMWAYRGDYTIGEAEAPSPSVKKQVDSPSSLLQHTKLYVFGDRFHIITLQDLSFARIQTLLSHLKLQDDYQEDGLILLKAIGFAADNLPTVDDRLIVCFLKLVASRLKFLAVLPEFAELVHAQPEVALELKFDQRRPWLRKDTDYWNKAPRRSRCKTSPCDFVGFPNVRCKHAYCGFICGDARPGYVRDEWVLFTCPSCGKPENLIEVCPKCGGTAFTWVSA
ncbi:hypothetical protein BDZ91DRAFT_785756 [Kalaharituber pfeilii]|nr:hypothetical protein BDZ91DRAFT_785756 [Kalaharituber pfeilii]